MIKRIDRSTRTMFELRLAAEISQWHDLQSETIYSIQSRMQSIIDTMWEKHTKKHAYWYYSRLDIVNKRAYVEAVHIQDDDKHYTIIEYKQVPDGE